MIPFCSLLILFSMTNSIYFSLLCRSPQRIWFVVFNNQSLSLKIIQPNFNETKNMKICKVKCTINPLSIHRLASDSIRISNHTVYPGHRLHNTVPGVYIGRRAVPQCLIVGSANHRISVCRFVCVFNVQSTNLHLASLRPFCPTTITA